MRNNATKSLIILSLSLFSLQLGLTGASAEQPADKKKDAIPELSMPYGVEKKYSFTPGVGYTTDKNVADRFQSQVNQWNADYVAGLGCGNNCPTDVAENGATAVVVCPTSMSDEEMRLCLGLPAVKKNVRVKRLNVQLGQAQ